MLKKIISVLTLITFPLSLFFANTTANFIHYVIPAMLVLSSYYLFSKRKKYYFLPLFIILFVEPKFVILPFLFLIINYSKKNLPFLFISILLILFFWKPFFGQTIFTHDYEAGQQALQKSQLYHSVPLARIFQNKLRIPLGKLSDNFFQIVDPNNYFFGFAPRQIILNDQDIENFPFLSLPFMLIGFYYIRKSKNKKFILSILIAIVVNLSTLKIYDRNDFILWIPLSAIILEGLNIFDEKINKKMKILYYLIFIVLTTIQIMRIII